MNGFGTKLSSSASGCQLLCHATMSSHLYFPITVECILCVCDPEEGTVQIRRTPVTLSQKERQPWLEAACQASKSFTCFPYWRHLGIWAPSSAGICNLVNIVSAPWVYKVSEMDQEEPLTSVFDLLPQGSRFHFWQRPDILGCQQKEAIKFFTFCAVRFSFLALTLFHWHCVLIPLKARIALASRKGTVLHPSVTSKVLEKWFLSPPSLPFLGFVLSFFPVQMSTFKAYIQLSKYWNLM